MNSTKPREEAQPAKPMHVARRPYVAPRLEYAGNVRDVLGKTGPSKDVGSKTNPQRP